METWKTVLIVNHPTNEGEQWASIQLPKGKPAIDISTVENDNFTREEFTKVVKLIAAAPELLEALKYCVCVFEAQLDQDEPYYKQALSVIQKATV